MAVSVKYTLDEMLTKEMPAGVLFFITEEQKMKAGFTDTFPKFPQKLGDTPYVFYCEFKRTSEGSYPIQKKYIIYKGEELLVYDYMIDRILSNEDGEGKYPWLYL